MSQSPYQPDDLGLLPRWDPPRRQPDDHWTITPHYFASYSKRRRPLVENAADSNADPGNLAVVVNRYLPRIDMSAQHGQGVTLILAHANGMHKESWEPVLAHLAQIPETPYISEIWAIEPVHHGDAGMLNNDADLIVDVMNYPVDLIEFVNRRLPLVFGREDLPVHLPQHDVHYRPNVIAVGHSIGGTAVIQAALHSAESFAGLILIEPLVANPVTNIHKPFELVAKATAKRTDTFQSKAALIAHFSKHPVYKAWAPESIRIFAEHATFILPDGSIALKTSRAYEAELASIRSNYQSAWYSLRSLSVPVVFIYGTTSVLLPSFSKVLTSKQPLNASTLMAEGGHLLVQENPKDSAGSICKALEHLCNPSTKLHTKL